MSMMFGFDGGFSDGGVSSGSDPARPDWLAFLCSTAYGPPSRETADADVPLTRLMRAIDSKQDVAYLLQTDKRIFPNVDISHGNTPLMYAVARNNADAVRALIAHPLLYRDAMNNYGCTALDIARMLGHQDIETILRSRPGPLITTSRPTPLPTADWQEAASSRIVSSTYLRAAFRNACETKDVGTLLRFTYAHKLMEQYELNDLVKTAMQQPSNLPVVTILLAYGANPNVVVTASLDTACDLAIIKCGDEGREYVRHAMLWAPDPHDPVNNDFTDLRRDFKAYSAGRLRWECSVELDRWGDRSNMSRAHRVAYAVAQDRRRNPFTRVKLDDATLGKLFLGAIERDDIGFAIHMIADGLKPFAAIDALGGPPYGAGQASSQLYRDFQNGLLSSAPYTQVKKDKWNIG